MLVQGSMVQNMGLILEIIGDEVHLPSVRTHSGETSAHPGEYRGFDTYE
jgi:hypothetical protein